MSIESMEEGDGGQSQVSTPALDEAKLRLVQGRGQLSEGQSRALGTAIQNKRKRDEEFLMPVCAGPDGEGAEELQAIGPELLADVKLVLETDRWDGQPSGKDWLKEWLQEGEQWAKCLQEAVAKGPLFCFPCWRMHRSSDEFQKHLLGKDHRKKARTWVWRCGTVAGACDLQEPSQGASPEVGQRVVSKASADLLAKADELRKTPAADAKRRLLEYRNSLSTEERQELISRIGLPRANDVEDLKTLAKHFPKEVAADLELVNDMNWICREPTFSWLTGFYWHPSCTTLMQQGWGHSQYFCHLCEADTGNEDQYAQHLTSRRHAENAFRWAESNGNLDYPQQCGRCPGTASSGREDLGLDLEHRRAEDGDEQPPSETEPPVGFDDCWTGDKGTVLAVPYVALALKLDCRASAVRVVSTWTIGPREKSHEKQSRKRRFGVDLFWCEATRSWRSLAIPVKDPPRDREGWVDFAVTIRWSESETEPFQDFGNTFHVKAPPNGQVAIHTREVSEANSEGWDDWKPILEFVGRGQVEAAGGVSSLRGKQIPMQFATEDSIISFMLQVPESSDPQPLLLFFHGDMPRGVQNCPQPGLADFVPQYGPVLIAMDPKRYRHASRKFLTVTPCCSEEVWWLRYPALHDSKSYVPAVERCLKGLITHLQDLGLARRDEGVRLAGQSMGGYMALEFARCMPEGTAAVFAGAPCFDACRLDWLAKRLVNVPVWMLIGRNDVMCSFEECASLALKMKDENAKLIRLTSVGIKGHSEIGKKMEKSDYFEWLLDPFDPRL